MLLAAVEVIAVAIVTGDCIIAKGTPAADRARRSAAVQGSPVVIGGSDDANRDEVNRDEATYTANRDEAYRDEANRDTKREARREP